MNSLCEKSTKSLSRAAAQRDAPYKLATTSIRNALLEPPPAPPEGTCVEQLLVVIGIAMGFRSRLRQLRARFHGKVVRKDNDSSSNKHDDETQLLSPSLPDSTETASRLPDFGCLCRTRQWDCLAQHLQQPYARMWLEEEEEEDQQGPISSTRSFQQPRRRHYATASTTGRKSPAVPPLLTLLKYQPPLELVQQVLQIDTTVQSGLTTALHTAAQYNSTVDVLECLKAYCRGVDAQDIYGRTPLLLLLLHQHKPTLQQVQILATTSRVVQLADQRHRTPLDCTKSKEIRTYLQGLIEQGEMQEENAVEENTLTKRGLATCSLPTSIESSTKKQLTSQASTSTTVDTTTITKSEPSEGSTLLTTEVHSLSSDRSESPSQILLETTPNVQQQQQQQQQQQTPTTNIPTTTVRHYRHRIHITRRSIPYEMPDEQDRTPNTSSLDQSNDDDSLPTEIDATVHESLRSSFTVVEQSSILSQVVPNHHQPWLLYNAATTACCASFDPAVLDESMDNNNNNTTTTTDDDDDELLLLLLNPLEDNIATMEDSWNAQPQAAAVDDNDDSVEFPLIRTEKKSYGMKEEFL